MYKISIIVTIHNSGKYLENCLESLSNQTYQNIEIICVNDCSSDDSLKIIEKFSLTDERFKIINLSKNFGTLEARSIGIKNVSGDYVMFVDGDDALNNEACLILYKQILKHKHDILCFDTKVLSTNHFIEDEETKRVADYLKLRFIFRKNLYGESIFYGCFKNKKFTFTLWNKVYKSSILKKANKLIIHGYYTLSEDLYLFALILIFAKSIHFVNKKLYLYNFGVGVSSLHKESYSIFDFKIRLSVFDLIKHIIEIYKQYNKANNFKHIFNKLIEENIYNCLNILVFETCSDSYQLYGDELLSKVNIVQLLNIISKDYHKYIPKLVKFFVGSKKLKSNKKNIKNVGIYYYRLSKGGVEKVISYLARMFSDNYNVIIFVDKLPDNPEYYEKLGIKIILLPSGFDKKTKYTLRANTISKAIRTYKIDIILYQCCWSSLLFYDLIYFKYNNILFSCTNHEVFSQFMVTLSEEMYSNRIEILKLCDGLQVLSEPEKFIWDNLGIKSMYIPNLMQIDLSDEVKSDFNHNIIWVGRLENNIKKIDDALNAFKIISEFVPDSNLFIVGEADSTTEMKRCIKYTIDKKIRNRVIFCGYTNDVNKYYKKSSLYICTSLSESYSMSAREAMAFGLPIISYNLPFVESYKNNKGVILVEQGDYKQIAYEAIKLFKDEKKLKYMSKCSFEESKMLESFNVKERWEKFFDKCLNHNFDNDKYLNDVSGALKTIVLHYLHGVQFYNNKINESYQIKQIFQYFKMKLKTTLKKIKCKF